MNEYFNVKEIWRQSNLFPDYEVSNYTQVRESKTGNILKQELIDKRIRGYYYVTLLFKDKEIKCKVDDLVSDAFPDADESKQKYMNVNGKPRIVHDGYCSDKRISPQYYDKAKVRSVDNGKIYDSIRDCSLDIGVPMSRIAMSMESNILGADIRKSKREKDGIDYGTKRYEQINYVPLMKNEED